MYDIIHVIYCNIYSTVIFVVIFNISGFQEFLKDTDKINI